MEKFYLNEEAENEEGLPSIIQMGLEYKDKPFPAVVDRYFTRFYSKRTSANGDNEDHLVLCHSNKICLVMLAKSHIAFKKGIVSIDYNIGNCDRSQSLAKGKHKKGAMNLQSETALAIIKTADGSNYKIYSCIQSKLLEVNERVKEDYKKLEIEGVGYIAIVLLKHENLEKLTSALIDEINYTPS